MKVRQDKQPLNSFSTLAPVALDLVVALASQAYVERAFSVCAETLQTGVTEINTNTEQGMFVRMNKK